MTLLTTRRTLPEVLADDLGFHDASSSYAVHSLHAFAAKFPPQLPRTFIRDLTDPGDVVLDPMMGSGTTVLEAALLGRRAIGVDLDPLALLLARTKTTPVQPELVRLAAGRVVAEAAVRFALRRADLQAERSRRFDAPSRSFLDYWFLEETQDELTALLLAIEQESDPRVADILRVLFSSVIITKSGGVSLAMDLAHSRPHRVQTKKPRSAIKQFEARTRKALVALEDMPLSVPEVRILQGDARALPLRPSSVDLIITSPPYANAIDYMRAHKFSLVWFQRPVDELAQIRSTYIGSERCQGLQGGDLPEDTLCALSAVSALDSGKHKILRKYFLDMKQAISEMFRVLRPGCPAGIVVGPSTIRGLRIETQVHLASIASSLGFDVAGIAERKLDRDRRMMPASHRNGSMNGFEQRMHQEYVIGLTKS